MGSDHREARTAEWDAGEYHRLANPHIAWGHRVLASLPLRGDETVLDAGCGSGRLTAELLHHLPDGRVIALDRSANMLQEARSHLLPRFDGRVSFVRADLQDFRLEETVDAIFSTATFHWVLDHPRLFHNLFRVLRPGGWLAAQCGGGPNIAMVRQRADALTATAPYSEYFTGWSGPWEFAGEQETVVRLRSAGFVDVETGLEESPVVLSGAQEYRDYLETVVFGAHLARLPDAHLRDRFLDTLTEQAASDDPPYMLDYWRLNLKGRRPAERQSRPEME